MTNKEELLSRIIDAPDTLSDTDISTILTDSELCKLYSAAVAFGRAGISTPAFDVESGLAELHNKMPQASPNRMRWAVAASIAVIFCLGVAAATIYHFAQKATEMETQSSEAAATEVPAPKPDFFIFDNVEMEKVAATLAKHYRLTPVFENEAVKHLRIYIKVNKAKTIKEVVEQLNELDEFIVSVSDGKLIIK